MRCYSDSDTVTQVNVILERYLHRFDSRKKNHTQCVIRLIDNVAQSP